jgi:hypothetical protein
VFKIILSDNWLALESPSLSDSSSTPIYLLFDCLYHSYVHFHALNSSFGAIAIILVHISRHLLGTIGGRLFAIIKGLEHSCVGTGLWQQEVVLEHTVILSRLLPSVELGWSIVLQILHEARMGLIHNIIVVRSGLLWRVVKPRSCRIWILVESFLHLTLIFVVVCLPADRAAAVRELAPRIRLIRLVKSVGMTVRSRFSSPAYSRVISAGYLRTKLTIIVQVRNIAQSADILIIDGLFPAVRGWIRRGIELAPVIVVVGLITIYRHVIDICHGITGTSRLPLLP